jgi:Na+-transporting methylmalonyl-CoA/oxaloacetate decarboxylase gamma subunit
MDSIIIALKLTGLGLGGVFISLIILYVLVRVTCSVFKDKIPKEEER